MEIKLTQAGALTVQQKRAYHCGASFDHRLSYFIQLISSLFAVTAFVVLIIQLIMQVLMRSGLQKIENAHDIAIKTALPLSVIVVAKNEAFNLKKNLPSLLACNYPNFEVVLVDDYSEDTTFSVMMDFAAADPRVKVIKNKHQKSGKKNALKTAIGVASNEYLVFTDADCTVGPDWLTSFSKAFNAQANFVIGHGAYERGETWFSEFYAFEAHKSAMLYFAAASHSFPYMCVGRSMAYTKALFHSTSGFDRHAHIQSGSDDLFLQSVKSKAQFSLHPEAVSFSISPSSIKRWMVQRKRHLSAGTHYPISALVLIFCYEVSNLLTPLVYLFLLFSKHPQLPLITLLLIARILLFRSNAQKFSGLVKSTDDVSQLWWTEYPMSWLNALISMNIGWMKKEAWTTRR